MQTRRRPPLDPTAALRPKGPLEKQAMNSFRRKVNAANDTSICGASSLEVGRKTMRQISESNTYCVPIFQRRYCWSEVQWQTLLNDVLHRRSTQHSLGRLTCTSLDGNGQTNNKSLLTGIEGRPIILDGQQRFTTTKETPQKAVTIHSTSTSTSTSTRYTVSIQFIKYKY